MTVPVSADEKLEEEQKGIIEFMKREAGRSEELTSIPLETEMTIFVDNPQIRCKTPLYQHCQRPPYPSLVRDS